MRTSSIKVFSLLITSVGEATGINCEYLLDILLILIWCILKLGTFLSRLISSVLYWYAVENKVSFKSINNYLAVSYYYITTDQDDVRNFRHTLPYRCRRERARIASIQTLKRGNQKCGNEDVFNLVKDSVDGIIKKEVLNNLLDILVQKQSIKRNKIGNRGRLSLPKETSQVSNKLTSGQKSVDCSQATVQYSQLIEDTSQATVETSCSETFIQSNFEGALNFKVELENLKLQVIAEIKILFLMKLVH